MKKNNDDAKIEELIERYKKFAKRNGFRLNPNEKVVRELVKVTLEREKRYGKRYCPCQRVKNIPEEDKKIICPCVYCREEIKRYGHCHCFLFVK